MNGNIFIRSTMYVFLQELVQSSYLAAKCISYMCTLLQCGHSICIHTYMHIYIYIADEDLMVETFRIYQLLMKTSGSKHSEFTNC